MRIISGKHKGRKLTAPKKLPVRPTTDRAKEGLFNILNNRFDFSETRVLDLFSGTGNMAYEFASRGAKNIVAVDVNRDCARFIEKTSIELEMNITTIKSDVFSFLENRKTTADIIFADPPYNFTEEEIKRIIHLCQEHKTISPDGNLIIEHTVQLDFSKMTGFFERRNYGSSAFSFFEAG